MAFEYRLVGLYRQELILIHKKRMHFQQCLKIVRNLHLKFNGSIMNSPHLITCYLGKNVAPVDLPMTSNKYGWIGSFVEDSRNAKLSLRQLFYCYGRTL
jgi:hypothetical protein